jgi:hypothetical protein
VQTETEEVRRIPQKPQHHACQLHQGMEQAWDSQHMQGTLLRQGNHS